MGYVFRSAVIYTLLCCFVPVLDTFYFMLNVTCNYEQLWLNNFIPFKGIFCTSNCPF